MKNFSLENAKKLAAFKAIEDNIQSNYIVGIGSGSTIVYAVQRLFEIVRDRNILVTCVPTSFQAKELILKYKLPLSSLETTPELDVCIDGADEVDEHLNLIKGGGGCLFQEKLVASCSRRLIIVADYTKNSKHLGQHYKNGIPIEVCPIAYVPVLNRLRAMYKGDFDLRIATSGKVGPVVTDNGNFIIDWKHFDISLDWKVVNQEIQMIPGVFETGLFINMAEQAYFGLDDGKIEVLSKPKV